MPLAAGTTLGHYEIGALLGKGGMGEVYRARDSKLGRDVAIKVLPEALMQDAEGLARLEREARALAALDHTHIASIHGFENVGGVRFLVMQLVDGEDLSARLLRGAVPLDEALAIARQIALALEAAHEKGIVHRDLKPANIKIDPEGRVRVLDFGLARALGSDDADGDLANSPTKTRASTLAGVILGTAAYMSPEQARGSRVDERADIWAFGVVMWEMLAGTRLFSGDTVSDVLAGVLRAEIDFGALPSTTPSEIRTLLRRCLARDPRNRLHDIADARLVIDDVLAGVSGDAGTAVAGAAGTTRSRPAIAIWLAAMAIAAGIVGWIGYSTGAGRTAPREAQRFAIQLAPHQDLQGPGNSLLAFAPDGASLVFAGSENGRHMLFRRDLALRDAVTIPGTDDGQAAFFSPDGRWIGFTARGQLMKIPAEGGRPFQIGDSRGAGGGTWLGDGTIVFAPIYSDGLFRVSSDGGSPERLTEPDRASGELGHWWPTPLPGDRHILFTAFRTPIDRSRIGVLDLSTRKVQWVADGFFGRWVDTGHLIYARGQRLYAAPFDASAGAVRGASVAVLDQLSVSQTGGFAHVAVSSRGTLAYLDDSLATPSTELVWLDRFGRATPAMPGRHRIGSVSLSPDGSRAALTIQGESLDLWVYAFDRNTLSRLTSGPETEFDPMWSHDGRELFYVLDRPPFQLHRIGISSTDGGRPIWNDTPTLDSTNIAAIPDGSGVAYTLTEPGTGRNLYVRAIVGDEPQRPIRVARSDLNYASFSPDGRWVVYASDETGRFEIYVEAFPGPGQRVQISADGGNEPLWARNGEIFYRRHNDFLVVATRRGERFEFEAPRRLFTHSTPPGAGGETTRTFDVSADGRRVIVISIPDVSRPRRIEVVTDWTRELSRLVPRAK